MGFRYFSARSLALPCLLFPRLLWLCPTHCYWNPLQGRLKGTKNLALQSFPWVSEKPSLPLNQQPHFLSVLLFLLYCCKIHFPPVSRISLFPSQKNFSTSLLKFQPNNSFPNAYHLFPPSDCQRPISSPSSPNFSLFGLSGSQPLRTLSFFCLKQCLLIQYSQALFSLHFGLGTNRKLPSLSYSFLLFLLLLCPSAPLNTTQGAGFCLHALLFQTEWVEFASSLVLPQLQITQKNSLFG